MENFQLGVQMAGQEEPVKKLEGAIKEQKEQIEDLEDDLEETKGEAKNTQKKLDKTKSELKSLQSELDQIKDEHGKVKDELNTARQNLEFTEKDLGVKKESINFVNGILNAKEASDERTLEINEKTNEIMYFVRDSICEEFKKIYKKGKEIADKINYEICKWANLQRKTWLKDKVIVAFIGEFSAGKTSIVNRIFTQDKKDPIFTLPVDRGATTAVATYISYGKNTKVQFTDAVGELRELSKEMFLQFTKDSLENISVSRLVSYFVTEYNTETLKRLSILDTPGFSSGDKEDAARTIEVINEADMLFWVVDANIGEINTTSLGIIKEHVKDIPLYVIINKVDTQAPAEREKIEKKMRETMGKAQIQARGFIQFSKKEPLETLTKVISTVQSRRSDYDVIADINEQFNDLIKRYKEKIDEEKKKINEYQRAINEADSIIEAFGRRGTAKIESVNKITEKMRNEELIGNTIFGKGNKIKDVYLFERLSNQKDEICNELLQLYHEYACKLEDRAFKLSEKSKFDFDVKDYKEKQKRFQDLQSEFNEKLKKLGIETHSVSYKQSSSGSICVECIYNGNCFRPVPNELTGCGIFLRRGAK
jgi:predicted GTPase